MQAFRTACWHAFNTLKLSPIDVVRDLIPLHGSYDALQRGPEKSVNSFQLNFQVFRDRLLDDGVQEVCDEHT